MIKTIDLARALFIVHSLTTIWATVQVQNEPSIWGFALISLGIIVEGAYTIIMRAGDERKWYFLFLVFYLKNISGFHPAFFYTFYQLLRQYGFSRQNFVNGALHKVWLTPK